MGFAIGSVSLRCSYAPLCFSLGQSPGSPLHSTEAIMIVGSVHVFVSPVGLGKYLRQSIILTLCVAMYCNTDV